MKRLAYLMFCALIVPIAVQAQGGLEGTARPVVNPARELEMMRMVPNCAPNTPVVVSGTRFVCGQQFTTAQLFDLVFNQHARQQCTALGGSVVTDSGVSFCRFTASACPAGWAQYQNWASYVRQYFNGNTFGCNTPDRAWANSPAPTCREPGSSGGSAGTFTARASTIGCY